MLLIRRQPRVSLKFQSNNSSVPLHSSNRMAKPALPRKPCIARCDIDLRGDGWRGATVTCLASQQFPRLLTNSSPTIEVSDQHLLDWFGVKVCCRRLILGLGAGFV